MTTSLTIVGPVGEFSTTFPNESGHKLYRKMSVTHEQTLQFVAYELRTGS